MREEDREGKEGEGLKKVGAEERREGNRKARRQQNIEKRKEKQLMEKIHSEDGVGL